MSERPAVLVIGLPARFRGHALEASLRAAGVEPRRIDGVDPRTDRVDGRSPADHLTARGGAVAHDRRLTETEAACALAHLRAWRAAADGPHHWTLVLEDDATEIDLDAVATVIAGLEPVAVPTVVLGFAGGLLPGTAALDLGSTRLRETLVTPYGAVGYLVDRSAARVLADAALPLISPADWPARAEGRVRYLVAEPGFVDHGGDGDSQVGPRQHVEVPRALRPWRRIARCLWLPWLCPGHRVPARAYWRLQIATPLLWRAWAGASLGSRRHRAVARAAHLLCAQPGRPLRSAGSGAVS